MRTRAILATVSFVWAGVHAACTPTYVRKGTDCIANNTTRAGADACLAALRAASPLDGGFSDAEARILADMKASADRSRALLEKGLGDGGRYD